MKTCSKCGVEKPLSEFYKDRTRKDGHSSRCAECIRACEYDRNRNRNPDEKRNNHLRKLYGITLEDYDAMLEEQGGCCAVCGTDTPGGKGRFHVDHNHSTGEVRGLLCHQCNTGLGKFGDDVTILAKAIAYLNERGSYGES